MESHNRTRRGTLRPNRWLLPLCGLVLSLGSATRAQAQNTDFVWIEGETTSAANVTPRVEGT